MLHFELQIDLSLPGPAYRHIVDSLRALLVAGRLQPGDRLPSSRALSEDLGVHFNTVAEAYRLLAEEGWLKLQRRNGAVVSLRETPRNVSKTAAADCVERLRRLLAEMKAIGMASRDIRDEFARAVCEGG